MQFKLNVERLLKSLGTPSEIKARFDAAGLPAVSVKGIQKWREKGSVSSKWLTNLIMLPSFSAKGRPLDVREFIEREDTNA